jgi:CBS domain-containing protein
MLHTTKFGALPVLRDGRLAGILTDNDIVRCLVELMVQGG